MSLLPGLGLTEPTPNSQSAAEPSVTIRVDSGCEWRFEVNLLATVKVQLSSGTAELFGTELALGQTYTFSGTKAAIYTWHGCTLVVTRGETIPALAAGLASATAVPTGLGPAAGGCQVEYIAEETPMMEYANVHFGLEAQRERVERARARARTAGQRDRDADVDGPRVLILGPDDAGKTSLAKILTAYATKRGRQPIVVNLDPTEGMLSVPPGGLTATAFRTMIDVEEGWGSSPISGPSPVPVKLPLVYFYALRSPLAAAGAMYKPLVRRLGVAVASRLAEDADARTAGVIIDTPGSISAGGAVADDVINHIVSEFAVNTILVLGSERLYSSIHRTYNNKPVRGSRTPAAGAAETISVVKLSKSGGCVGRDENYMRPVREAQTRAYFFGRPYTGICGSDVHYYEHGSIGDFVVKEPMVLGHESAGVIVKVGPAVTSLKVGDRVALEPGVPCRRCPFCKAGDYNLCIHMKFAATPPYDGTLAQFYVLPEDYCYKLPEQMTLQEGCLMEPLGVAVHLTKQGDVKPGNSVVVLGAGPVGLLTCGVAKAFGAVKVVVVDIQEKRAKFAVDNGFATHYYIPERVEPAVSAQKIIEQFGLGFGADVVIDASGAEPCIHMGIYVVKNGGSYVQGGMGKDIIPFPINAACCKELTVKGSFRYGPGDYELALELIATGKINAKICITELVNFEKAEQAFLDVKSGKGIKTIIAAPDVRV
ncbi:hypothetical protein KEM52_006173 [Ascosphaera acerosa]|nr:hypothetical protein KEM52_006173 [Ascosphaera acerosa]